MQLVFATNNLNKLKEVQSLIPNNIKLLSLTDIGCVEDVPETRDTIEGNAIQKAAYIKEHYGYDCFADDTGLIVEALNGEPGVYSARYAGEQRSSEDNIQKILKLKLVDIAAIKAKNFSIVVDAVNSTGGIAVPKLLRAFASGPGTMYGQAQGQRCRALTAAERQGAEQHNAGQQQPRRKLRLE